jgi:hypothetical protein
MPVVDRDLAFGLDRLQRCHDRRRPPPDARVVAPITGDLLRHHLSDEALGIVHQPATERASPFRSTNAMCHMRPRTGGMSWSKPRVEWSTAEEPHRSHVKSLELLDEPAGVGMPAHRVERASDDNGVVAIERPDLSARRTVDANPASFNVAAIASAIPAVPPIFDPCATGTRPETSAQAFAPLLLHSSSGQ